MANFRLTAEGRRVCRNVMKNVTEVLDMDGVSKMIKVVRSDGSVHLTTPMNARSALERLRYDRVFEALSQAGVPASSSTDKVFDPHPYAWWAMTQTGASSLLILKVLVKAHHDGWNVSELLHDPTDQVEKPTPVSMPHSEVVSAQCEVNRANFLINVSHNWHHHKHHLDAEEVSPARVREHLVNAIGHLQRSLVEYDSKFPPAEKPAPTPRKKRGIAT